MGKVVIYRELHQNPEGIGCQVENYLAQAAESLRPFDGKIQYAWNTHRNRIDVHGERFTAEIVLVPKGIVVMVEIPVLWYPFRKRIEGGIIRILDTAIAQAEGYPKNSGKEDQP
jgi:hypothetical protein